MLSDSQRDVSNEHARRLSFGSVAEAYDRHRPGYPAEMIEAVLDYSRAQPGDRVLDVGAGTGRASLLFAARGYEVTAIEPDREMAAVASKQAATAGQTIEILNTEFERAALRPAFDRAYEAVGEEFAAHPGGPMNPLGQPPQIGHDRGWLEDELAGSPDFTELDVRVYRWRQRYTTEEYIGLLGTHSDHIVLPAEPRAWLLGAIREAIDAAGGSFELAYQTLLCLARRRAT